MRNSQRNGKKGRNSYTKASDDSHTTDQNRLFFPSQNRVHFIYESNLNNTYQSSTETTENRNLSSESRKTKTNIKNDYDEFQAEKEINKKSQKNQLTIQDLKYSLLALHLATLARIMPTEFDTNSWVAKIEEDERRAKKRKRLYELWQNFVRARIIIFIAVTIHTILNFSEAKTMVQILRNFSTILITFSSIGLYFGYFEATAYNMPTILITLNRLTESVKRNQHENENQNSKMQSSSFFSRPFSVTILIYLPFVIYSLMFIAAALMIRDPNSPIFLCSHASLLASPFESDSGTGAGKLHIFIVVGAYIGLTMLDILYYFFMISEIYTAVFFMLFFITQIEKEIEDAIEKLRLPGGLEQARKNLQVIKLLILLFNLTMSTIIYLTKLITLAGAIIGGFLMIQLLDSHPLLTIPFVLLFIEGNVVHTVLFDKVCQITRKVEQLKEKILIKAQNTNTNSSFGGRGKIEEYKRVCRSVQKLGIQAGGFYLMERETTLIFEGFVLQKIVDLLLTFT